MKLMGFGKSWKQKGTNEKSREIKGIFYSFQRTRLMGSSEKWQVFSCGLKRSLERCKLFVLRWEWGRELAGNEKESNQILVYKLQGKQGTHN